MNHSSNGLFAAGMLALAGLCVSQAAHAQFAVTPRLTIGSQKYDLKFEDVTSAASGGGIDFRDGFEIHDDLKFVGGGLGLSHGRLFADVSGQFTNTGQNVTTQFMGNAIGGGLTTQSHPIIDLLGPAAIGATGHNHVIASDFSRSEYNFTLGFAVTPTFSLYAGYKRAGLDVDQAVSPVQGVPGNSGVPFPDPGDVLFQGRYAMKFDYDGPYFGVTYAVPAGRHGALVLQSSVVHLDGSFTQKYTGLVTVLTSFGTAVTLNNATFRDGVVDGKSTGYNIGVAWTGDFGALNESLSRLSYAVGIDRSQYKFDGGSSQAFWAADFEETITRFRVDLRLRLGGGDD